MKCQSCGKEFEGNFCPNCGKPFIDPEVPTSNEQNNPPEFVFTDQTPTDFVYTDQPFPPSSPQPAKTEKPIYKRTWFIILCIFLVLVVLISLVSYMVTMNSETNEYEDENEYEYVENFENNEDYEAEITTQKATTKKSTTAAPKLSEKTFKAQCETIAFSTLSRNPDKYKGKKFKFTGEVIQVSETNLYGSTYCDLRINVTRNELFEGEYFWDDTIYATVTIPDGADRILEDDIITIWGTCEGNYTYTSILGSSVSLPKIDIKYFQIGY